VSVLDTDLLTVQTLSATDLSLLYRWFAAPHVARWYRKEATLSPAEIAAKYTPRITGGEPIQPFLIMYGTVPIGYIQIYMMDDAGAYPDAVPAGMGVAGLDLFIGEETYLHRGIGSALLRYVLRSIVFGRLGAAACVVDPEAANVGAIRTYERVGFRRVASACSENDDSSVVLMRIERAELLG
jgi:RimJ/RimL family protein N-acetyltransferase